MRTPRVLGRFGAPTLLESRQRFLRTGVGILLLVGGVAAHCGDLPGTTPVEPLKPAQTDTLTVSAAPSMLTADGASIAAVQVSSKRGFSGPVSLTTSAGVFTSSSATTTTVTLVNGSATALLRAPTTIGDSAALVSASSNGAIGSAKVTLAWAYPQQLAISADSFSISDTLGRRTITVLALHSPGVVTRGTRVDFSAQSTDSAGGSAVGVFDGPALTDSTGAVTVHYSLTGDRGRHSGAVTITAPAFDSTRKQAVSAQLQLAIVPPAAPAIVLARATSIFQAMVGASATPAVDSILVSNGGTGTLSGLSLGPVVYSAGAADWLRVNLTGVSASAGGSAIVTLAANTAGLSVGTYTATVPVSAQVNGVTGSPSTITVTLIVGS